MKVNCIGNCGAGCSRLKCSQQHSGRAQGDKTSPLNQNLIKALWSDKCRPTDHFSLLLRKLPNRNRPEPTLESKLILQKFMILIWTMHAHQSNEYHEFWGYISAKMPKLKGSEFKNPLPEPTEHTNCQKATWRFSRTEVHHCQLQSTGASSSFAHQFGRCEKLKMSATSKTEL